MAWTVRISPGAKKSLRKLDKTAVNRIFSYLTKNVENRSDPRLLGKSLKGELGELWRYRVGDYRIICKVDDDVVEVLVLRVGHRKDVYRG